MRKPIANYHVGQKILLRHEGKVLFLRVESKSFDFPGGRIDEDEKMVSLPQILSREIVEELGNGIRFKIGKPAFHYRRFWPENNLNVFLCVYEGEFLGGEIALSDEHENYEWIDVATYPFRREEFMSEEEYTNTMAYFGRA